MQKFFLSLFTLFYSLCFSAAAFAYVAVAGDIPENFLKALNMAQDYKLIGDEYQYTTFSLSSVIEKCSSKGEAGYAEVSYFLKEGQFRVAFYRKEVTGLTTKSGILVSKMVEKDKYKTTCKLKADGLNRLHGGAFYQLKPRIERAAYEEAKTNGTLARQQAQRKAEIEKAKRSWQITASDDGLLSGLIIASKASNSSEMNIWSLHYNKEISDFYIASAYRTRIIARNNEERKVMVEKCAQQTFDTQIIEINSRAIGFKRFCQFRGDSLFLDLRPATRKGQTYFINELKKKNSIIINKGKSKIEISAQGFSKVYNKLRQHYQK